MATNMMPPAVKRVCDHMKERQLNARKVDDLFITDWEAKQICQYFHDTCLYVGKLPENISGCLLFGVRLIVQP